MTPADRQRGTALVEFAGSLILLAVMCAGIFEIGYSFYSYATLVTAVRAGARYAAMQSHNAAAGPSLADNVRNIVVYGDPSPATAAKPVVSGLTTDAVEFINSAGSATVSVRGFRLDALFMKVNLDGRPTATFPIARGAGQ